VDDNVDDKILDDNDNHIDDDMEEKQRTKHYQ